jgi:hypothetical protein
MRGTALACLDQTDVEHRRMITRRDTFVSHSLAWLQQVAEWLWHVLDDRGLPGFRRRRS